MSVPSSSELHATVAQRLRADGQRYTTNRRALVRVLEATDRPLTIAEVLDRDDELAQSSTYRNLAVLEQATVVRRVVAEDEYARYELAEDLTGHHHHLICRACGRVEDFTVSARLETSLDRAFHRVSRQRGFDLEQHRMDLVGTCADCN